MALLARSETDPEERIELSGLDLNLEETLWVDDVVQKWRGSVNPLKAQAEKVISFWHKQKAQRERSPLEFRKGRKMIYNPDWHYRHGREMSVREMAYIVQHYKRGQVQALALDIGRTDDTVRTTFQRLRRDGLLATYMELDTTAFLEQLEQEERQFLQETGFSEHD